MVVDIINGEGGGDFTFTLMGERDPPEDRVYSSEDSKELEFTQRDGITKIVRVNPW